MPDEKPNSEADLGELNDKLAAGIETCRSVIANYRSFLSGSGDGRPDVEGNAAQEDRIEVPPTEE